MQRAASAFCCGVGYIGGGIDLWLGNVDGGNWWGSRRKGLVCRRRWDGEIETCMGKLKSEGKIVGGIFV